MEKISRGKLEDHEYIQMQTKGIRPLESAPLYIDDTAALNIFEFRAKARRLVNKHKVELIIIDYLQLMSGSGDRNSNREQEISGISRNLKILAKELNIPIIALSQLSRAVESRKESKMPQLSDLRESGAIEQDADMVMFLYRPDYYDQKQDEKGESVEGLTQVKIAKHRNGSLDTVNLKARLDIQKFEDWIGSMTPLNNYNQFLNRGKSSGEGEGGQVYLQMGSKMNDKKDFDQGLDEGPAPF
jgi:replicative DNA helicase